ncbi:hypothetical protein WICPIJ_002928 [Wickerhamomyces pijperi]|uniref:Uncharacterized protein n=1 Tax=Wickerhamomyces pijperi TaxID=599730 RepID=A0A9P8TPP9_WICPI|nr:hypothetical protein WICPIJ_002928 [Wickerhamomyces pijperi]
MFEGDIGEKKFDVVWIVSWITLGVSGAVDTVEVGILVFVELEVDKSVNGAETSGVIDSRFSFLSFVLMTGGFVADLTRTA